MDQRTFILDFHCQAAAQFQRGDQARGSLLSDAMNAGGNVIARLGVNTLLDLPTIMRRHLPLEDLLIDGPDGLLVLPLAADTLFLAKLGQEEQPPEGQTAAAGG